MNIAARMKMAHKLAIVVIALLLPLGYVSLQYARGLSSQISEHAHADDGLHYFEGLKEAGRALAAHASLTATVLSGEAIPLTSMRRSKTRRRRSTPALPCRMCPRRNTAHRTHRNALFGRKSSRTGKASARTG